MVKLFLNSTTDIALQIIIQEKELSFQKFKDRFNIKTRGKGSEDTRLKAIIGDLRNCGLVIKDQNNTIRPTEIALDIPLIIQKSQNPDENTYKKMMTLIDYLEDNELLIKHSILAYGKGVPSGKEFMDFLSSNFKIGSNDTSYSSAMRNFMKYMGILNEDLSYTSLGKNVYDTLSIKYNKENPIHIDELIPDFEDEENIVVINMENNGLNQLLDCKKQIILYGPPGTGKTFNTKRYAVEFLEGVFND